LDLTEAVLVNSLGFFKIPFTPMGHWSLGFRAGLGLITARGCKPISRLNGSVLG
jgi:hypothetical protein